MNDPNQPNDRRRGGSADTGADERTVTDERTMARRGGSAGDRQNESIRVGDDSRRNTALVSATVAAIGAWVSISVLVTAVRAATVWNNVVVGGVVLLAGAYNAYRLSNDIPLSVGVASLVTLLGLWLLVSTVLFEMTTFVFWSTVIAGILVAGLSGYNAYEARRARTAARPEPRGR